MLKGGRLYRRLVNRLWLNILFTYVCLLVNWPYRQNGQDFRTQRKG